LSWGLPIRGVNEFHPRPAAGGNLAFLEARSVIARLIPRRLVSALTSSLAEAPAVALLGPRQVSKTILALELANTRPAVDLESSGN
jgi:predicted AAA+ superfamily ATPase